MGTASVSKSSFPRCSSASAAAAPIYPRKNSVWTCCSKRKRSSGRLCSLRKPSRGRCLRAKYHFLPRYRRMPWCRRTERSDGRKTDASSLPRNLLYSVAPRLNGRRRGIISQNYMQHSAILGFGVYLPRYRIRTCDIARHWEQDERALVASLGVHQKSVAGRDEDTFTMAFEAARLALHI